jgi:hypothetical protein
MKPLVIIMNWKHQYPLRKSTIKLIYYTASSQEILERITKEEIRIITTATTTTFGSKSIPL